MRCLSLLSLAHLLAGVIGSIFDLSTLDWSLSNQNGSIVIPASVPSHVHLDLLEAGIISEPLLGINDYTQRWIVNDNWTYTADLGKFTQTQQPNSKHLLVFYGLDSIANITFAGHPVAWTNNQFRQYVFDISDIQPSSSTHGGNNITIAFESAWHYGLNVSHREDTQASKIPSALHLDVDYEYPGVRQYVRKTQSDFGWDWGPAFVPSGIYKAAHIISLPTDTILEDQSPIFIEETSVDIYKFGQNFSTAPVETADWIVNVTLAIRSAIAFDLPAITLSIPDLGLISAQLEVLPISGNPTDVSWVSAQWRIADGIPERWYPHNLGQPKLYNLSLSLDLGSPRHHQKSSQMSMHALSAHLVSFHVTTGFRTIQLIQSPYSDTESRERGITPGDQWHFRVNGRPFFTKGTNIIPMDPFYSRIDNHKVEWLLESAKASGQNTIRVWGGGIYQPSDRSTAGGGYDFYSLCDKLGLLVWSELIFSCDLYPINDFMRETIEVEVQQNVRRINQHPSNVQWAGGNEVELIVLAANKTVPGFQKYVDEYLALFQDFLKDVVTSETRSVTYTDCSTTHGVLSLDPHILRLGNRTEGHIYGNAELYNYDPSQSFNYSTYPSSRFVCEFGYHSMPSIYSWQEVLESSEDFGFNSTVVASRTRHPPAGSLEFPNPKSHIGQGQMSLATELWLPTPHTSDSNQTFAQECWSSQVFQAMYMVSSISWFRLGAGKAEHNLGSLLWQLNDIWQGASWSAIEYSGRWKVLMYGIAAVYSPVIISPFYFPNNETLQVYVTSDSWNTVHGIAQLTLFDWYGGNISSQSIIFTVPSLNNTLIYSGTGLNSFLLPDTDVADVWLYLELTAEVDSSITRHEQQFVPVSLADAALVDPMIKLTHVSDLTFRISAHGGVAPWTWIDHPANTVGYFVDVTSGRPCNGFYLIPEHDRTVKFLLDQATSTDKNPDPNAFVVRSVWNNTHA